MGLISVAVSDGWNNFLANANSALTHGANIRRRPRRLLADMYETLSVCKTFARLSKLDIRFVVFGCGLVYIIGIP